MRRFLHLVLDVCVFQEYEKDGKMYVDQDKVDEMVAEAYRQGVNYFDTAPKYCNCNSEEAVGRAVKGFVIRYCYQRKFR